MALPPASEEQQACIDALISGHNVVVKAQAGAGKSTMFLHAARAWLEVHPDAKILLVCYNVSLRSASESRVERLGMGESVSCYTVHALAGKIYQTNIGDTMTLFKYLKDSRAEKEAPEQFSLCLIDEGQDLTQSMVDVINVLQGLTFMQYMVVGDTRQAIYSFSRESEINVLDDPSSCLCDNGLPWKICKLLTSYRITPAVADFLNHGLRHPNDDGIVAGNFRSASVKPIYIIGDPEGGGLQSIMSEMLQTYKPDEIMILAPTINYKGNGCHQLAATLSEHLGVPIFSTHKRRSEVSDEMMRGKTILSSYHQSKGDERPCVIVLGVDVLLHRKHGYLVKDDSPIVPNELHVACTRAQETLILFQRFDQAPFPSLHPSRLEDVSVIRCTMRMRPKELSPLSLKPARLKITAITRFASEESISLLQDVLLCDEPVHLGPPVGTVHASSARMASGLVEDVGDYFRMAILSAVQKQLVAEITGSRHYKSRMEYELCTTIKSGGDKLPLMYRPHYDAVMKGVEPSGPRAWLVLSAIHNSRVKHNYLHELRQLDSFEWINEDEVTYFTSCVDNLLQLLRRQTDGFFYETGLRECARYKTTIRDEIIYCSTSVSGDTLPWQFSFTDEPSEEDFMTLMASMWLRYCTHGNIFCVPSNTLYKVHVHDDKTICDFVAHLIAQKRSVEIRAQDNVEELMMQYGSTL